MMHIHNGDLAANLAKRSDIPGEHVAFRESLITGPLAPGDGWIESRARALSDRYAEDVLRTRTSLVEQEQMLDSAPEQGEIVLWFEHDLYCLVHLVYLLQRFATARVSLVWCPTPVTTNDEGAMYLLFESRAAVTPSMLSTAAEVWRALTSPDPTTLHRWIDGDASDFPFLREGIALYASRFPSTFNGLGVVEQLALELIAAGTSEFLPLFDAINARLPRLGFGDAEVFRILRAMTTADVPLLTLTGEMPSALFAVTAAGLNVVSGEVDNLSVNTPDFWLGGVHLTKENVWRWDGNRLNRSPAS